MSKELTITEGAMPATFEELSGMAKAFVASGMFTDIKSLSQAIVKVQAGKELGIPPVYAMQNINMIKGRLCTSANTMALLVKRSGRYNYRILEHDDTVCNILFKELEGNAWVDIGESKFTLEDAKRAKLVYPDSAWVKYPRAMLFSRAISQGARLYTPDAIGGVYTSEEIKAIDGPTDDVPEAVPSDVVTVTDETTEPPQEVATPEQVTQAEKDSAKYWPADPPHAAAASQTAQTAAEGGKTTPEDITMIGQADTLPVGKPGMRLQVVETNEALEWEVVGKGGRWRNMGVNPQPEQRQHEPDTSDPAPATTVDFFKWLQIQGKKYGPTWFYQAFTGYNAASMKDPAVIAVAYQEVKKMMDW